MLEGPEPETAPRKIAEAPKKPVSYVPNGTAKENQPYFTKVMVQYGKSKKPVQAEPMLQALTKAGFQRKNMEATQSKDPWGNPAESVFVSVRFDQKCLIAQIVAKNRQVVVERGDAIGPDNNQCLIEHP